MNNAGPHEQCLTDTPRVYRSCSFHDGIMGVRIRWFPSWKDMVHFCWKKKMRRNGHPLSTLPWSGEPNSALMTARHFTPMMASSVLSVTVLMGIIVFVVVIAENSWWTKQSTTTLDTSGIWFLAFEPWVPTKDWKNSRKSVTAHPRPPTSPSTWPPINFWKQISLPSGEILCSSF